MNNAYAEVFATVLGENQIKINEPMSRHTTFGIGGPADCFLIPKTAEELCIVTRLAHKYGMPVFVLGGGANLLVRDKGIRGVVVFTGRLQKIEQNGNLLKVSSGVSTAQAARAAYESGLSGMERRRLYECRRLWRGNVKNHRFRHHLRPEGRPHYL